MLQLDNMTERETHAWHTGIQWGDFQCAIRYKNDPFYMDWGTEWRQEIEELCVEHGRMLIVGKGDGDKLRFSVQARKPK